ncbi:MAG: rod-binding protein [Planctomycetota bacterium]
MDSITNTPNFIGQGIEQLSQSGEPRDIEAIERTAAEFEGVFISLLTKEMRNSLPEGGLFGSEASDTFGSLFDLYIGQHLAESQPLGIANVFLQQYENQNSSPQLAGQNINEKIQ